MALRGNDRTDEHNRRITHKKIAPTGRDKRNWKRAFWRAPNATWRNLGPTKRQLAVIARIAHERGGKADQPTTRGEASDMITARANGDPRAARALRRAERARRRAEARTRDGDGRGAGH